MSRTITVGRRRVTLTSEEKIIFLRERITKKQLVSYYQRIAPYLLPHTKNRPLMLRRFPDGIEQEEFFQKDASSYFPKWIKQIKVSKQGNGVTHYVLCNEAAALVYLANQLTVEFHVWQSKVPKIRKPDRMVFDLDRSGTASLTLARWAARALRELLEQELGLVSFVMTTGSRGFHVVVPIKPLYSFDMVRTFMRDCAQLLVDRYPKKVTLEMRKAKRGNRIFLDVRNAFAQTSVAPYSLRAQPGAPVAMPITWDELGRVKPNQYTIKTDLCPPFT